MSEVRGKPGKSDVKEVDGRGEYAPGRLRKVETEKETWDLALWRLMVMMAKALVPGARHTDSSHSFPFLFPALLHSSIR